MLCTRFDVIKQMLKNSEYATRFHSQKIVNQQIYFIILYLSILLVIFILLYSSGCVLLVML